MKTATIIRAAPAAILLAAACGAQTNPDNLTPLIRQLQGHACVFTADPPIGPKPQQSCKPREGAAGLLQWLLASKEECVRDAAHCLAELGPAAKPAAPALIEAVRSGPNNYDTGDGTINVRDAIVEALGKTGDAQALPVLIEVLENPKPMDSGYGATGETSKQPIGEEAALRALGYMGSAAAAAVPRILPHLDRPGSGHYDNRVVEAAATALGLIGNPAAIPALTESLKRGATAHRSAEALGRFGPAAKDALPSLAELIEEAPDRDGEMLVRQAIAEIGGRAAAEALPKSYHAMMNEIWRLARETAKSRGVRLRKVHLNSPKEEIAITLPDGRTLVIGFLRDAWTSGRIAEGTVSIRRGEEESSPEKYRGTPHLVRLLARAIAAHSSIL